VKRSRLLIFLILFAPLTILLPGISQFAYPPHSIYSDITIAHIPYAIYLRQSLLNWGMIPLWSDAIFSGFPFAANPLAGLWYIPGWFALLFPFPLGFNLTALLHIMAGGIGMYFFIRSIKKTEYPALIGALIFECLPKLFGHFAAGHITLVYAVCWTPWLLWAEQMRQDRGQKKLYKYLVGIILGMIVLADIRWAAYSGMVWLCYSLYRSGSQSNRVFSFFKHSGNDSSEKGRANLFQWGLGIISQIVVALLIASPLLLPLVQFEQLSTRKLLVPSDNLILSLPPLNLFGLLVPDMEGSAEWMVYPGALSALLLVWILPSPQLRSQNKFWIALAIVTILFSLGSSIPLLQYLFYLPFFNLLRVPPRAIFLTGLASSVLAASGIEQLIQVVPKPDDKRGRWGQLLLVGITGFSIMLTAGIWIVTKAAPIEFIWSSAAITIFTILILGRARSKIEVKPWMMIIIPLLVLDLGEIDFSLLDYRPVASIYAEREALASFIKTQNGLFRIYSPSFSVPQLAAARYQLEMADGIDPLQLAGYVDFMQKATGVSNDGYSVTLPPITSGRPEIDNINSIPNLDLLGLLNVKYLVSDFELNESGLILLHTFDQTRIYENQKSMPRAWVQNRDSPVGEGIISSPDLQITPNNIKLTTMGPGLLVLSEINYPGWRVFVDGKPDHIESIINLLRGVSIPPGRHEVIFDFQPVLVYVGLALAITTWIIFFAYIFLFKSNE
jgi:hypothetical protein